MKNVIKKIVAVAMAFTLVGSYSGVINTPFTNHRNMATVSAAGFGVIKTDIAVITDRPLMCSNPLYIKPKDTVVAIFAMTPTWVKVSNADGGQWILRSCIKEISETEAIRLTGAPHNHADHMKKLSSEKIDNEVLKRTLTYITYRERFLVTYRCEACRNYSYTTIEKGEIKTYYYETYDDFGHGFMNGIPY